MKSILSTAVMLFAFGGVMVTFNSELYGWVKILGLVAIVMAIIAILVGLADWHSKKQKQLVR